MSALVEEMLDGMVDTEDYPETLRLCMKMIAEQKKFVCMSRQSFCCNAKICRDPYFSSSNNFEYRLATGSSSINRCRVFLKFCISLFL